ncbi:hypothetical protein QR680_002322 [Steinernema hermaphroditum]|uniref:Glycosyltransferase family 92 protein n=1 Tax=Steinernema hermaphroditum TaxID=289476 RepID=A0AA39H354_9BILA|nr:hypothetical protein QR680_002322 [Steinernema hermaphroditum]
MRKRHIIVISSTYYNQSKSIQNDTVVVLFNSHKRWYLEKPLICVSRNETHVEKSLAHVQFAYDPISICSWTAFVAHCPTVKSPNSFELSTAQYFASSTELPLRLPYQRKVDVVACYSPLFYNERWQLIVNTLEVYRQYGVGVQAFYVQSMLHEIMDLLKDAAKFIIISDIDDVLFPRIGETYIEEFMKLSSDYPNAAGFTYNRYNAEVTTTLNPQEFSLSNLIDSSEIHHEWEDGKSVYNPERVFTAWIHWPGLTHSPGYKMHLVPSHENIMVHMRKWKMYFDVFDLRIQDIISRHKTKQLQREFNRTFAQTEEFKRLPTKVRYYPLIAECYQKIFYDKRKHPDSCPGPINCFLPPMPNVKCSVAKTDFVFNKVHDGLFMHYPHQSRFVTHLDGCNMLS